eukprot:2576026-Pyramimonas_sp.AAC.1
MAGALGHARARPRKDVRPHLYPAVAHASRSMSTHHLGNNKKQEAPMLRFFGFCLPLEQENEDDDGGKDNEEG